MKKIIKSRARFILIPILATGFLFLISFVVMHLWNYTLTAVLGVKVINLWQSMALFVLCKLLFGFGGGGPRRNGPPWRKAAMRRKFEQMDEAEKALFKARMRERWCQWGSDQKVGFTDSDTDGTNNDKETN